MNLAATLRTPWQDLPPGWRWVIWGIGALIPGLPLLDAAVGLGRFPTEEVPHVLSLTWPWMAAFLAVAAAGRHRPRVLAYGLVLGLLGLLFLPFGHT